MIEYDKWCYRCKHYQFNNENGILCGLTNEKPTFTTTCETYVYDPGKGRRLQNTSKKLNNRLQRSKRLALSYLIAGLAPTTLLLLPLGILINMLINGNSFNYRNVSQNLSIVWFPGAIGIGMLYLSYSYYNESKQLSKFNQKIDELRSNKSNKSHVINSLLKNTTLKSPSVIEKKLLRFTSGFYTTKRIDKWLKDKDYKKLIYAYHNCNYQIREHIVKHLGKYNNSISTELLIYALYDPIFSVVKFAADSLNSHQLSKKLHQPIIEQVLSLWEAEEKRIEENWKKSSYTDFHGKYIDKDQLRQLKELKRQLNRFKGSMSIG